MSKKVKVNVGAFDVPPHEVYKVPIGLAIPGAREPNSIDLVLGSNGTHGDLYAAYLRYLTPEQRLAMPDEKQHHSAELGLGVFDENIDRLPSIIPFKQTTEKTMAVAEPARRLALCALHVVLYERYDLGPFRNTMGTVELSRRAIAQAAKEIAL
jgi:hypothetical protein